MVFHLFLFPSVHLRPNSSVTGLTSLSARPSSTLNPKPGLLSCLDFFTLPPLNCSNLLLLLWVPYWNAHCLKIRQEISDANGTLLSLSDSAFQLFAFFVVFLCVFQLMLMCLAARSRRPPLSFMESLLWFAHPSTHTLGRWLRWASTDVSHKLPYVSFNVSVPYLFPQSTNHTIEKERKWSIAVFTEEDTAEKTSNLLGDLSANSATRKIS